MTIKSDLKTIAQHYKYEYSVDKYKKDICAARFNFHCLIDTLCKEGDISCKTHQNVDIRLNKHNQLVLDCLSYSLKI